MYKYSDWKRHWSDLDLPWACESADDRFVDEYPRLVRKFMNNLPGDVFVPLCGNSRVVSFLASQNVSVTALDYVAEALLALRQAYFRDWCFETRSSSAGGTVYSSGKLELVEQDIFLFEREAGFDLIYDRAALVAIEPAKRQEYAKKIQQLLRPSGLIHLTVSDFDGSKLPGPPFPASLEEIQELYRHTAVVDIIREERVPTTTRFLEAGIVKTVNARAVLQKIS